MPPIAKGELQYPVRLIHFTRAESPNGNIQAVFEVSDPDTNTQSIEVAEIDSSSLYNWFLENNLVKRSMGRTTGLRRMASTA